MTDEQAKLNRDKDYRIAALKLAIMRAGQDGGVEGKFDVYVAAEQYYAWLKGDLETQKPKGENDSSS